LLGYNFAHHGGINASESNFAKANRKIDIVKVKPQTPRTIINEIEVDSQEEAEKLANSSVTSEVIIQSSQNQDKIQTFDNSYYIQVAAYISTKTYPTVKKIKALGFENVQVKDEESRIGLLHKVLVGPYASKNEAKRDLRRLKRVNKKAYIIKG
jgi:cell division septation protein DedD